MAGRRGSANSHRAAGEPGDVNGFAAAWRETYVKLGRDPGSVAISDMATFRARAGYAVGIFLPYMFGGVALGEANIVRTANITGSQSLPPTFIPVDLTGTAGQFSHLIYGYSGGLGVDMMLMSCLFLRAEWEYVRFTSAIDTDVNTFRVGLGYKF